MMYTLYSRYLV